METTTLDTIARTLSGSRLTRRSALRGLVAGAAAAIAGGALLPSEETAAKQRTKRKKGSKSGKRPQSGQPLLPPGSRCQSSSQCVSGYICEVPVNGSNSDRYCSGGAGAICGAPNGDEDDTAPFCAVGHRCTLTGASYTCQVVPDEI